MFQGPSGCADLPPMPPSNVLVVPGDERLTVSWERPGNGACVDQYTVSATPRGIAVRSFPSPLASSGFQLTIQGLTNGVIYDIEVTAAARGYPGASAHAVGTPHGQACLPLPPSAPTLLKAQPLDSGMHVCWGGPLNFACVDEFRVSAEPVDNRMRTFLLPLLKSRGGCVDVQGLINGVAYRFTVQAYSKAFNGGDSASIIATPGQQGLYQQTAYQPQQQQQAYQQPAYQPQQQPGPGSGLNLGKLLGAASALTSGLGGSSSTGGNGMFPEIGRQQRSAAPAGSGSGWTCTPVDSYPLCSAAASGACTPLSCDQQAAYGQCGASFLRSIDPGTNTVTQYCATACGCPDMATFDPSKDVQAFSGPTDSSCCAS